MKPGLNLFLSLFDHFGRLGNWLFLFIAMFECVPFIGAIFPGGTLISVGGFLAAQGYFNVQDIIIFALVGAVIGDYVSYLLGRWGRPWLEKNKIIRPELLHKGEAFFIKYGNKSIFWGRFIGPLRAVVPFVAGTSRLKQGPFLFWSTASSIIWAGFTVGLGYFSGNIIAVVIRRWSHRLGLILIILIAIGLLYWLIRKHGQSFWLDFKKHSHVFTEKLLSGRWYAVLDEHYPVISELEWTHAKEEKIYGLFLAIVVLIFLYILVLVL
ncbi:MAG: DedA family protein [Patescibacteria group bacterium]|jgi:undecaprenyl-diphosphatase